MAGHEDEEGLYGLHVGITTGVTPREDGTMELSYRVDNQLDDPILLLTPLSKLEKNVVKAVKDRLYAYVDPEGVLQVTKRAWAVPAAMDVFFPEVPFVTEVLPGNSFEERISLKLPVLIDYPYRPMGDPKGKREEIIAEAQGFAFSIGYIVEANGPLRRQARESSGVSLGVTYGIAMKHQRVLQAGVLEIGVPVKDWKG